VTDPTPTEHVEIHLPAGTLTAAALQALADIAHAHGDHTLHLTEHGQLLLHGDRQRLATALADAGSTVHGPDRRRVLASPLSGRRGGLRDIRPVSAALVAALTADPAGDADTVFGIDDGTGDIAALRPDRALQALPNGDFAVVHHGRVTGVTADTATAVTTLLRTPDPTVDTGTGTGTGTGPAAPIGWLPQTDDAVTLAGGLPGGVLPARTAEFLAAVDHPIVITPWRSVLLCDLDEWTAEQAVRVLAPMGVVFDADSPLLT